MARRYYDRDGNYQGKSQSGCVTVVMSFFGICLIVGLIAKAGPVGWGITGGIVLLVIIGLIMQAGDKSKAGGKSKAGESKGAKPK